MERLPRTLAGCGLMLLLAAGGCRSLRSNVPPGRPYSADGRQSPPINFSSDPHALNGTNSPMMGGQTGTPGGLPMSPGGMTNPYGTPAQGASNYGAPTSGSYGPPGSSGLVGGTGSGVSTGPITSPSLSTGASDPTATPPMSTQPGSSLPMAMPPTTSLGSGLPGATGEAR